jgi:hypothetical protein
MVTGRVSEEPTAIPRFHIELGHCYLPVALVTYYLQNER